MSVHINAKKEDIASVVLMPGDPLRAKYIANEFLDDMREVTNVRNVLGFTGFYKGKRVTVMASGMGIPSMGIYCYELFNEYNVEVIIRIGTCGAYDRSLRLRDTIIVKEAYTDSNFAYNFNLCKLNHVDADNDITNKLIKSAKDNNIEAKYANILSSEVFYRNNTLYEEYIEKYNVVGVEMESFALFYVAKVLNKKAACLLTVSDCVYPNNYGELTSQERQESVDNMIIIALNSIL